MQRVSNFGSLLQSYSLMKMLQELGHDVSFMDIERRNEDDKLLGNAYQCFEEEREKTSDNFLLSKLKRVDQYAVNRIKIKLRSYRQDIVFEQFRRNQLGIKNEDNRKHFDYCVIGSDEVFNCLADTAWGFTSQLFGDVKQADKVITYAASCGATTYEKLPNDVAEKIMETFKNVTALSVRDDNTRDFVEHLTEKEVSINLDPVLIYNFEKEMEAATLPKCPEKYCIIYSYYNRIHSKNEINGILLFCKKHHLTPIAIGAPQFWCKTYIPCTPFECLKVFKNADYVITDTFHGTIFSVKYAKRFAVLTRESNKNKLMDLVTRLNIKVHLIKDCSKLESNYQIIKDESNIQEILKAEREKTINYLKRSVN